MSDIVYKIQEYQQPQPILRIETDPLVNRSEAATQKRVIVYKKWGHPHRKTGGIASEREMNIWRKEGRKGKVWDEHNL